MRARGRWEGLLALACACVGADAAAQSTYRIANGPSAVLQRSSGFMEADFGEARLGFAAIYRLGSSPISVVGRAAAAGRAGQWDMFAGMDWVPGVDVGAGLVVTLADSPRTSTAVMIALGFRTAQRKLAAFVDDTSSLMRTSEETQRDVVATAGLHQQITPTVVVGAAAILRRQYDGPGTARPTEICVPTYNGWYTLPICNDRYLEALQDRWTTQLRADALVGIRRLSQRGIMPSVGFAGAAAMDLTPGAPRILNVGGGPAIIAARYPGQMIVAVLFEVRDALDAEDTVPEYYSRLGLDAADFVNDFGYRFGLRLVVGVPFPVFVERR